MRLSTSFVLGYHGCSTETGEAILTGRASMTQSSNPYDWLGKGAYFWEANPHRGLEFYREAQVRKGAISDDAMVIGAVIDLGHCLDLSTSAGVDIVLKAHGKLKNIYKVANIPLPKNKGGKDLLVRDLDCAVINYLHHSLEEDKKTPYDVVRGVFIEGHRIYNNAGFYKRTHVQLSVCNMENIKGFFRVNTDEF